MPSSTVPKLDSYHLEKLYIFLMYGSECNLTPCVLSPERKPSVLVFTNVTNQIFPIVIHNIEATQENKIFYLL